MRELKLPIYLDNHATTKPDPRVVEAMMPYFADHYGNAASAQHQFGWEAEAAVNLAAKQIAALIGADSDGVVFTSGATESINLALKGCAEGLAHRGNHVVTVQTEHKAVLDTCRRLERYGFEVTYLPVDRDGMIDPQEVAKAITDKTILVSAMLANNEIGTIYPVDQIGGMCRERGVLFHTDATQAVGKIPVDVRRMNIDLMSFSAHKMYGPKGVGALYIRMVQPRMKILPQMDGGGHQRGLRSGTLNVPAIVGFGKAAELARFERDSDALRTAVLRDRLVGDIQARLPDVRVNGHPTQRLPNNASLTFGGVQADRLMMDMKDIAVSSGSACSSATKESSHVLEAIGLSSTDALATLRFGLGRFSTVEEIDYAIHRIVETVVAARATKRATQFTLT